MLLEHEFHLARVDVEAARDDQLLDASADGERAVVADLPNAAGPEESDGGEGLGRRARVAPVALEGLAAFQVHLGQRAQAALAARKRIADATSLARPLIRVGHRDAAFSDAVA